MKVLIVNWRDLENPRAGGAEVHLFEVFGRLAARGHQIHLLASGFDGAPAQAVVGGITVHRVSTEYGFALAGRGAFRRLAASLRPDVVVEDVNKIPLFLPGLWRGPFVLLVPHLFGTTAFHEAPWPIALGVWLAERPMPRAYARARVHAISSSTRSDLLARGFREGAVEVIYPGVDTAAFSGRPDVPRDGSPAFLYVGRLKRYKQVDTAIRALRLLLDRGRADARLWIAGSGDVRPRLEALTRRLGLMASVEFLGRVSEERKLDLYRRAWAVVLPSRKEGWGITNLEAAACGTPAVAADNSALRESVRHGETGFLVPTGEVAQWAEALGRIATEPALLAKLSEQARAFALGFSWERCAEQTESHLEAALSERRGQEN